MEHSEQDSAHARVRAQISLSCSPWRARGQHGAPAIAGDRYCLGACARAASRTSALSDCCATAVALQTCGTAASKWKSTTIEAVADREVAAGSGSTGDPELTSATRSGQPCPTHAARAQQRWGCALRHKLYILGVPVSDLVPPYMQQVSRSRRRPWLKVKTQILSLIETRCRSVCDVLTLTWDRPGKLILMRTR